MKTRRFATHNPPDNPVFDYLKSGAKTIEGRPYSTKYHQVAAGDRIVFVNGSSQHKATVKSVKKYKTLSAYLQGEGLKRTLPGVTTVKEGTRVYDKWSSPGQRSKLRQKHGYAMIAIRV